MCGLGTQLSADPAANVVRSVPNPHPHPNHLPPTHHAQPHPLVLALHNHQPVGNFDDVFQQAFDDSYRRFWTFSAAIRSLKISLHVSGSLMEWLAAHQPEYVDRLARVGRAGADRDPRRGLFRADPGDDSLVRPRRPNPQLHPLAAKPPGRHDPRLLGAGTRLGAVVRPRPGRRRHRIHRARRFPLQVRRPDRVATDRPPADRGRRARAVGVPRQRAAALPDSVRRSPQQTIDYLAKMAEEHPDAIAVFGDDGEKFGTWPETKKHVYDDGWLARFFDALVQNQEWIQVTTLAEAFDNVPPVGKIYLPDCSYREMTEWALPTERLVEYERIAHEMQDDPRWASLRPFVRGGFWRNFKVKYPEADEMYCRMMIVSRRLQETLAAAAAGDPVNAELVEQARAELYRGQCNCGYWHGAFGGIYLPHLRNAVYQHLIAADNLLDRAVGRPETWIEAAADDFNFDARQEVRLTNDKLMALVAPSRGGQMTELDVRRIQHNLLATLARRPEAYHQKVLRRRASKRRPGGQHPRARRVQAARPRPAAAIRRPPAQEPGRSVLRQRRDAGSRWRPARRRSAAISSAATTKPASAATPTASRCNCSATATPAACRCGSPRA